VSAVVSALAFHQCDAGLVSCPAVICGLSLLVLYSVLGVFPLDNEVFPSHQKPAFD